ncbi:MAG: hypothetical protein R2712_02310 [Vicinamibacterales bacterium]
MALEIGQRRQVHAHHAEPAERHQHESLVEREAECAPHRLDRVAGTPGDERHVHDGGAGGESAGHRQP